MSLRSSLTRLAIAGAAGALATAAAVTPAAASGDRGDDPGAARHDDGAHETWSHHGSHEHEQTGPYKGVVTASTLLLRSAPNRGGQVIRTAHRGDVVSIFCKTAGQNIQGNPLWYLLTDGTWAWGAARYIDNIGPAPRWC
ncbi:SH3 domain-containing protein [Streptomyces sp. MS06]|uniref:SH3 domain-containing protein n=1 Tax=Streptomyces sp. MS06 TaxID=3385974 RepID=UPI00399FB723